jgi:TnpA family transposase
MTAPDRQDLTAWLIWEVCPGGLSVEAAIERAYAWCRDRGVLSPTGGELHRQVRSARLDFETALFARVAAGLGPATVLSMEDSLAEPPKGIGFDELKADPGPVSLESVLTTAERLSFIRGLRLPASIVGCAGTPLLTELRRRVAHETGWEMRRHPASRRLGLYAIFLAHREREITDGLVDLLVEVVHKFSVKAERKIEAALAKDFQKVHGKTRLLARIAEVSIARPDDAVREVVFPVADEATLANVVKEYKAGGTYDRRVHAVLRSSYAKHYRRMLRPVLETLEFRSNNSLHQPVLDALARIRQIRDEGGRHILLEDDQVISEIIPAKWRNLVLEKDRSGGRKISLINYEICVLTVLRERLRCKEIWVVGADRYRNPDEDLPRDFEARRSHYYQSLGLTEDGKAFIAKIRAEATAALRGLNDNILFNRKVKLQWRGRNRIMISPLEALPAPANLDAVKAEIESRWDVTALLDVVTETAIRTGFLDEFRTSGTRVALDAETLGRRLILCLYGIGTNAGLKRISAATDGVAYSDLLYVRRRFLQKEALRSASAMVSNAILAIRNPAIWGEAGTACASDSKKFGAWDRNLVTEWHARYRGPGVMIYWHVERRSNCIYSQLKRCSSSEVGAMIEGVLRHCTDMTIQRQYVDSHGQSEVAFAFCRLLGFELAPRLKAIARQKLYLPDAELRGALGNLAPILSKVIDWDLIERQYDEMVKFTAALQHHTAEPEAILRRFASTAVRHPTYEALQQLGRIVKTIFLCRYLADEAFRREIHDGLNVVESWNSANGFIFFGKGGEIASNRLEDQEMAALSLHLLQNCLVYVNTLMLQQVLSEPGWEARMTQEDWRALTPLLYAHINPYGRFDPDFDRRIDFERVAA